MCHGKNFIEVIDFGLSPLVNSLLEKDQLDQKEPEYPLVVEQCQDCFLVQIVDTVDSHEIYKGVDYLYFSGDMPGLSDYFKEYADFLRLSFLDSDDFIVEIGSNDGTMLQHFPTQTVLGVDPASNVVVRALAKGIPTLADFFSARIARSIKREAEEAKLIYGNNCIAHLGNLDDLMEGVTELLSHDGVFAVECNYWGNMVKNKNYALIYHDHFSYFSLKNWMDYAKKWGMKVFDATVTPAQGGSLRVFMDRGVREETERCVELYGDEVVSNLNSPATAGVYRASVLEEARKLKRLVSDIKAEGKTIAGYGAAAKGFSVLQLAKITGEEIDYFVDDSPAKQGKYTPITHIPVISRMEAEKKLPDYFFITAPNYEGVIIEKEGIFQKSGGKFITCDSRII